MSLGPVAHAGGQAPKQPSVAHDGKAIASYQNERRKRRLSMKHATKHDSRFTFAIRVR